MKRILLLSLLISFNSFSQTEFFGYDHPSRYGYNWFSFGEYDLKQKYIIKNSELFYGFLSLTEMESSPHYRDPDLDSEDDWNLIKKWGGIFRNNALYFYDKIEDINKRDFKSFKSFIINTLPLMYTSFSWEYNWISPFVFRFNDIKFDFITGDSGRIIASAHSPLEDDIRLIINIDKWEELNNYERIWLLLHELGHEAFGFDHGFNELMYPLIPNELKDTREEYFMGQLPYRLKKTKNERYIAILKNKIHGNTYDNMMKAGGPMVSGYKPEATVSIAFNVMFDGIMSFFKSIEDDVWEAENNGRRSLIIHEYFSRADYIDYETGEVMPRLLRQYSGYPLGSSDRIMSDNIKKEFPIRPFVERMEISAKYNKLDYPQLIKIFCVSPPCY